MLPNRRLLSVDISCVVCAFIAATARAGDRPEVELGVEHRARFEVVDPQYRADYPAYDQALALRTSLRFAATWPRAGFVLEFMDSRAELAEPEGPKSTAIVNALEFIQAAAFWSFGAVGRADSNTLRIGLLTKDIGGRRLIARNRFRNTLNTFTGLDWDWAGPSGLRLNAFLLHPMQRLPETDTALGDNERMADNVSRHTFVNGVSAQAPLFGAGIVGEALLLKVHGPDTRLPAAGSQDIETISLRAWRPAQRGQWDFDVEIVRQRGEVLPAISAAALDHDAKFAHLEAGYSADGPRALRLGVEYDYASGDKQPDDGRNERFDTLFGARRFELGPSGIFGPFVRSNIKSFGARFTSRISPRATWFAAYRGFWLASSTDAWETAGLRDPTGAAGDYIGRQLETALTWEAVPDRWLLEIGFAHLRYGRFALTAPQATGPSISAYFYGQLTYRFKMGWGA